VSAILWYNIFVRMEQKKKEKPLISPGLPILDENEKQYRNEE